LGRFVGALQRAQAGLASPIGEETARLMTTPHVDLPAEGDWTALPGLGMRAPDRSGLGLFLEGRERFSHLGGAFGFFSVLTGSLGDGSGAVVMSASDPTPYVFELLLAIDADRGWRGFRS